MTPGKPGIILRFLQRLCPHMLGWSSIPTGRFRFCRCCGKRQRLVGGVWVFPEHVNHWPQRAWA